jgi:hypothetical protein
VKPGLRETLGFDLVDMRDVATAGVIDNIMRAQIRGREFESRRVRQIPRFFPYFIELYERSAVRSQYGPQ